MTERGDGGKLSKKKKKIMSKSVTSEHNREISNLIHEEVVVEWRREYGLLKAVKNCTHGFLKCFCLQLRKSRHLSGNIYLM